MLEVDLAVGLADRDHSILKVDQVLPLQARQLGQRAIRFRDIVEGDDNKLSHVILLPSARKHLPAARLSLKSARDERAKQGVCSRATAYVAVANEVLLSKPVIV